MAEQAEHHSKSLIMFEKAAKALFDDDEAMGVADAMQPSVAATWRSARKHEKDKHRRQVRIVIEAIREPDYAMIGAANSDPEGPSDGDIWVSWTRMIDHLLKEASGG